jgi:hypothetical protein
MQFTESRLNAAIETAKTKAASPAKWLRAIERAATALRSGELLVTPLHDGAPVTPPRGSYHVNGSCECESDCAELRQAGVELRLEKAEVDGKPAVILTLLEVSFCGTCETFHGTKEPHTCIR